MSISKNNIIDIDDSTVFENTPMVIVEQNGRSFAIPMAVPGGDVTQRVVTDTTAIEAVITEVRPNTHYVFTQPLQSLSINSVADSNFESEIEFTVDSTLDTLSFDCPDDIKFIGVDIFYGGCSYIINIKNKIAVRGMYE